MMSEEIIATNPMAAVAAPTITAFDVWHVRRFVMPGSILGLSPIEYARQSIGLGLATEQFGGQFFGDGAVPSGMLTADGKLTPDQASELQTQWTISHGKRRKTAVLGGGIKYTPITVKNDESQFIETMKLNAAQIARVFGVPAAMIGAQHDNSLTYATVESRALDYLRYSLSPWLVSIEHALGRLLPARQFVKFKTGGLLKADIKTRYETYAARVAERHPDPRRGAGTRGSPPAARGISRGRSCSRWSGKQRAGHARRDDGSRMTTSAEREYSREYARRWRAKNPERNRENARRWVANNRDKVREGEPAMAREEPREGPRGGTTSPGTRCLVSDLERRAFGTQGVEVRSEEEPILSGVLVPYGSPTKIGFYTETFARGALQGADPGSIPLLNGHAHAQLPSAGRSAWRTPPPPWCGRDG